MDEFDFDEEYERIALGLEMGSVAGLLVEERRCVTPPPSSSPQNVLGGLYVAFPPACPTEAG